jgi:hypothetical protein
MPGTPRVTAHNNDEMLASFPSDLDGGLQSLLSLPQSGEGGFEGMGDWGAPLNDGFAWPTEFSPSNLPVWLQDGNFTDLGLPQDGSDSLFLPLEYVHSPARSSGQAVIRADRAGLPTCFYLLERSRMRITHSRCPTPEMQGQRRGR